LTGRRRAELLESLGPAGKLVRLLDGPGAGQVAVVTAALADQFDISPPVALHRGAPSPAAVARADGLLRSLLTPRQAQEWAALGRFWVPSDAGWFQLGRLYDIRHRPRRWPWVERAICVVSEGYEQRPVADLWAELVVTVAADPEQLVAVANWRAEAAHRPPRAPHRAAVEPWLRDVRRRWRQLRHEGAELDAAFLAGGTAVRLAQLGRQRWAAHYADAADAILNELTRRHPAEQAPLGALRHDLAARTGPTGQTSGAATS